jgi:DNA repair protein REV1
MSNVVQPHKFMGHGYCDNLSKSSQLAFHTNDAADIARECIALYRSLAVDPLDVRGLGITMQKLEDSNKVIDKTSPSKGSH